MNLPFFLLVIVALDCIGLISNIRMLLKLLGCCLRKENKYRFLVPWMTCQFVYQIVFLVTVTMYAWNIYIDDNYEYCCTLRRLKETVEILELLNLFHLVAIFWSESEQVRGLLRSTTPTLIISVALPGMAIMNFAILFWPLQELSRDIANLAIFFLLIFNVLALKFLYSCFAPKENRTEAVENTLEGLIFSLMDKETENISLESLLSWRNCLKDKSLALFSGILSLVIFIVYVPSSRVAFYSGSTLKQISLYTLLVFQNIFFGTFIPSFFSLCINSISRKLKSTYVYGEFPL